MDAKTLARWRRMAEASAPGLVAEESCRRVEIHDGESVWAMMDAATKIDHDNAAFWAEARGIVLALLDEVEECEECGMKAKSGEACEGCLLEKERLEMAESRRQAAWDDKAKEMREEK